MEFSIPNHNQNCSPLLILFYLNIHSAEPNPEYQDILQLIHIETICPTLY